MIGDAALTWNLLRTARRSSHLPTDWFRRRQVSVLQRLLRHAYDKVPLYRNLYDEAGFRPDVFQTLDDLPRIPSLTKRRLQDTSPGDTVSRGTDLLTCHGVGTSGTTGIPLQVWLGQYERCWQRAVAWRILFEHGFSWRDKTLEIRMIPGRCYAVQKLGLAPKEWLSILDSPSVWVDRIAEVHYDCIVAGAGTLDLLTAAAEARRLKSPRLVISDSEPLTPTIRSRIRTVFGVDPVDVYGLVEVSNFAWQCEQRAGLHVSADSHIVEVAAPAGVPGPLTVTALGMWTMPIIRYETGDLAETAEAPCSCGRNLPLLKAVHGRVVDSIIVAGGRHLLWPFFHELLGSERDIVQWQVHQVGESNLVVRTVLRSDAVDTAERLQTLIRGYLPQDIQILIEPVTSIPVEANGKQRLVIPFSR